MKVITFEEYENDHLYKHLLEIFKSNKELFIKEDIIGADTYYHSENLKEFEEDLEYMVKTDCENIYVDHTNSFFGNRIFNTKTMKMYTIKDTNENRTNKTIIDYFTNIPYEMNNKFGVVDIPDDVEWFIEKDEWDNSECVCEKHRYWFDDFRRGDVE